MPIALNQVGQETLIVSETPVGLTRPAYETNAVGVVISRMTPRHALIRVFNAAIRYRADTDPSSMIGTYVAPGDHNNGVIDWTDEGRDFFGMIKNVKFVRDIDATGDATLEIDYYG